MDLSSQHFYIQKSKNKFLKLDGQLDQNIVTALSKANPGNVEAIDGGPNCFGDSGKNHNSDLSDIHLCLNCLPICEEGRIIACNAKSFCQPSVYQMPG